MGAKKKSYVRDSFSGTLQIFTITLQSNCCHLLSLNAQVQKNCILVEILQFSTFWFMPFLVRDVFGLCCFWFVPFLVCAVFSSCSFWFVLFWVRALFGSCSFGCMLFLVCALFGS